VPQRSDLTVDLLLDPAGARGVVRELMGEYHEVSPEVDLGIAAQVVRRGPDLPKPRVAFERDGDGELRPRNVVGPFAREEKSAGVTPRIDLNASLVLDVVIVGVQREGLEAGLVEVKLFEFRWGRAKHVAVFKPADLRRELPHVGLEGGENVSVAERRECHDGCQSWSSGRFR